MRRACQRPRRPGEQSSVSAALGDSELPTWAGGRVLQLDFSLQGLERLTTSLTRKISHQFVVLGVFFFFFDKPERNCSKLLLNFLNDLTHRLEMLP